MRALGYPRLISIESFRNPNFRLVADALFWLTTQYDSTAEVPDDINSDNARVEFLKVVAQTIYTKARIKLNVKQLYKADGYAVKELLKVSSMLYDAMQLGTDPASGGAAGANKPAAGSSSASSSSSSSSSAAAAAAAGTASGAGASAGTAGSAAAAPPLTAIQVSQKLDHLKAAPERARDIIDCGERLTVALQQEDSVRVARDQALAFLQAITLEPGAGGSSSSSSGGVGGGAAGDPSAVVRREIAEQLDVLTAAAAEAQRVADALSKEEAALSQKVSQKDSEYERQAKRVAALRKVRPGFLDEFEQVEGELEKAYATYVERFRNLQYLEAELAKHQAADVERREESGRALRKLQRKLRADEVKMMRGEAAAPSRAGALRGSGAGVGDEEGDEDEEDEEEGLGGRDDDLVRDDDDDDDLGGGGAGLGKGAGAAGLGGRGRVGFDPRQASVIPARVRPGEGKGLSGGMSAGGAGRGFESDDADLSQGGVRGGGVIRDEDGGLGGDDDDDGALTPAGGFGGGPGGAGAGVSRRASLEARGVGGGGDFHVLARPGYTGRVTAAVRGSMTADDDDDDDDDDGRPAPPPARGGVGARPGAGYGARPGAALPGGSRGPATGLDDASGDDDLAAADF